MFCLALHGLVNFFILKENYLGNRNLITTLAIGRQPALLIGHTQRELVSQIFDFQISDSLLHAAVQRAEAGTGDNFDTTDIRRLFAACRDIRWDANHLRKGIVVFHRFSSRFRLNTAQPSLNITWLETAQRLLRCGQKINVLFPITCTLKYFYLAIRSISSYFHWFLLIPFAARQPIRVVLRQLREANVDDIRRMKGLFHNMLIIFKVFFKSCW